MKKSLLIILLAVMALGNINIFCGYSPQEVQTLAQEAEECLKDRKNLDPCIRREYYWTDYSRNRLELAKKLGNKEDLSLQEAFDKISYNIDTYDSSVKTVGMVGSAFGLLAFGYWVLPQKMPKDANTRAPDQAEGDKNTTSGTGVLTTDNTQGEVEDKPPKMGNNSPQVANPSVATDNLQMIAAQKMTTHPLAIIAENLTEVVGSELATWAYLETSLKEQMDQHKPNQCPECIEKHRKTEQVLQASFQKSRITGQKLQATLEEWKATLAIWASLETSLKELMVATADQPKANQEQALQAFLQKSRITITAQELQATLEQLNATKK